MKKVNSLSGGKTSSYLAVKYPADYEVFSLVCLDDKRCAPKDKGLIQYVNDKLEKFIPEYGEFTATAEDDKTLVVMRDLEQFKHLTPLLMITINTGKIELLLVEVPMGSRNIVVNDGDLYYIPKLAPIIVQLGDKNIANYIKLPEGNYTFLCTTETITEDIAKGIVDKSRYSNKYKNYCYKKGDLAHYNYALESSKSLLLANNLDPNRCYAILQKKN